MSGPEVQFNDIRVGLAIEGNAPFEAWHERLLGELDALTGVALTEVFLDSALCHPAFDSALASAAFQLDSLVTRRKVMELRPEWRHAAVARKGDAGEPDILIDLRAVVPCAKTNSERETWSVDFLRGPISPERHGMHVAVAGAGAFSVTLERRTPEGFERIDQAVCAVRPSAVRNLDQARQVIIAMILRSLRARIAGARQRTMMPPADQLAPLAEEHDHALKFARSFASYAAARGADSLSKRVSAWTGSLAPHFRLHHAKGSPLNFAPGTAQALEANRKQYLADPFLFRQDGHLWAFFEIFDYQDDTGAIGVAELTESGLGPVRTVLGGGGHMSYPHVFAHGAEIYMMPESCARRRIEVWRAVRFPYEWELVSTALDGAYAVDSDIHFDGRKWWVFTNVAFDPSVDAGLELSVYEADGPLLKKLTPHSLNPVVADVRYARNGGRVFWRDGKLYRPAQSLEYGKYGYGLYIMEVAHLSLDSYSERPVRFIRGCHHLDSEGDDVIFDLKRGVSVQEAAGRGRSA